MMRKLYAFPLMTNLVSFLATGYDKAKANALYKSTFNMLNYCCLLVFLVFSSQISMAQPSESVQGFNPFAAGVSRISLQNPLDFEFGSYVYDNDKQYDFTDFDFNASYDYFIREGIGIGGMLDYGRYTRKYEGDYSYTDADFLLGVHFIYGTFLSGYPVYIKPSIGFGNEKSITRSGTLTNESKDRVFQFGIQAGSPIQLATGSNVFIEPVIGWNYFKYTDGDNTARYNKDSRLYLGANLSVYLFPEDMKCGIETGFEGSLDRFSEGKHFVEYSTRFALNHFNYKWIDETGSVTSEDEDRENDLDFYINYKYSIADRVLIGGRLSADFYKYNYYDEADEDYTRGSSLTIGPAVEYHPLQDQILSNLFVEAGFGLGRASYLYVDPDGETESKSNIFTRDLAVGFDYKVASNFSLVPRLGVESYRRKNTESDIPGVTTNGFFSVGGRISF